MYSFRRDRYNMSLVVMQYKISINGVDQLLQFHTCIRDSEHFECANCTRSNCTTVIIKNGFCPEFSPFLPRCDFNIIYYVNPLQLL